MNLSDDNFVMRLFLKTVTDLLDGSEEHEEGTLAFHRDDVIALLADEIDQLDAGGRKELATAIFEIAAARVWGKH